VFADEAEIEVKGGDGGDGIVSLRHEKRLAKGGPDGGNGGRGGDVVVVADSHLRTLIDVTHRVQYRAEDGGRGGPNRRKGRDGDDVEIRLPVGTIIRGLAEDGAVADLVRPGQRAVVARGGRGGRGNASFASATRRTPRFAEKGEAGQARRLALELKLLADVGIVGLPNVGKSTLIARVSAARPKIADYPFTTLVPNLGVVRVEDGVSFVVADLPGLVEGAHRGAGRGHEFLRHAERTRVLIHVVDLTAPSGSPYGDFLALNQELALYREDLASRPQLVALNKMDLLPPEGDVSEVECLLQEKGYEVFRVSALTGEGVVRLMGRAAEILAEAPEVSGEESALPPEAPEMRAEPLRVVRLAEGCYEVGGEEVERAVAVTDLDNEEALRHLHQRLERSGVIRRLRHLGAKDGDRVRIGGVELDFVD
jgi:GTP-binding protein